MVRWRRYPQGDPRLSLGGLGSNHPHLYTHFLSRSCGKTVKPVGKKGRVIHSSDAYRLRAVENWLYSRRLLTRHPHFLHAHSPIQHESLKSPLGTTFDIFPKRCSQYDVPL